MRDLSKNMRASGFRSEWLALGGLALLALALGAATGDWLGAAALAAAGAALAASWRSVLNLIGISGPGAAASDDLREELEEVGKVAHDAAEDLARMEDILEEIVNENRRATAENASGLKQVKNRLAALDSTETATHGRLSALEGRLESLDEGVAALRSLSETQSRRMAAEPAPSVSSSSSSASGGYGGLSAGASAGGRGDSDSSATFLADVAPSSRRRRPETPPPPPQPQAQSRPPQPPPAPLAPEPAPPSAPSGGGGMADLAETLRHRAREAQQARRAAAQSRPLEGGGSAGSGVHRQMEEAYADPRPPAAESGGISSLTPLASLAAMAGGGAPAPQPQAPQPQPQQQRPSGANGAARPGGQGQGQGPGAPQPLAPGQSAPIYALAPRVVAGHQMGVAETASVGDRLRLAASKAAELAAAGVEEGVHLPMRAAHLSGAAAGEVEAFLNANPELGRRLVLVVPVGDLEALAVEPIDALRAHGVALRADVPSPDGLNAEHFSRLKVELAAAPGLLALAMAPHAMQMGMALMASDVAEPVMLQALSIAGIPLVSGPATELLAQAGPAPMPPQQ